MPDCACYLLGELLRTCLIIIHVHCFSFFKEKSTIFFKAIHSSRSQVESQPQQVSYIIFFPCVLGGWRLSDGLELSPCVWLLWYESRAGSAQDPCSPGYCFQEWSARCIRGQPRWFVHVRPIACPTSTTNSCGNKPLVAMQKVQQHPVRILSHNRT